MHRPIRRLQRRSMDLASKGCHLVAQHDDLDGEIRVAATDEPNQLEDAAERPVEEGEGEGHCRMLAAPESRRQNAGDRRWTPFRPRQARFVHDTLELAGWSVEIADPRKVKGLAPFRHHRDRVDDST